MLDAADALPVGRNLDQVSLIVDLDRLQGRQYATSGMTEQRPGGQVLHEPDGLGYRAELDAPCCRPVVVGQELGRLMLVPQRRPGKYLAREGIDQEQSQPWVRYGRVGELLFRFQQHTDHRHAFVFRIDPQVAAASGPQWGMGPLISLIRFHRICIMDDNRVGLTALGRQIDTCYATLHEGRTQGHVLLTAER